MSAATPPTASVPPWSTVTIALRSDRTHDRSDALPTSTIDRLDELAGILATHDHVSGVEQRDATTFDGPPQPELVVYTAPAHLEVVMDVARQGLAAHGLADTFDAAGATHTDDSWLDGWKDFYRPLRFGGLLVRPSWTPRQADDPTEEIVLDPGRAFGTGQHETTHLCLEAFVDGLDDAERAGLRHVLDLGCGSGILALAAARLAPQATVVAIDNDPEAVETTRENAEINGLGDRVHAVVGTVDDVPARPFDLIFANIRPAVLIPQAPAIAAKLGHGRARLLLSGILDEEAEAVHAAYRQLGLRALEPPRHRGEWVALSYGSPA